MQVSRVIYRLALVGDLEAALTHAKVHGIHVDEPGIGLVFRSFSKVGLLVLVYWYFYVDFRASSLSDGLNKTRKSRVRVNSLIDDKPTPTCLIDGREIRFVILYFLS